MTDVLLDFEELPQCGNSLRVLRCKTPCLDCVHPEGVPLRKGLEGRGRKTIIGPSLNSQSEFTFRLSLRFCCMEFARCANSMLVSSVEFCLRQNSRSKTIMGPDSNSQSEFTFRLSKRIYDRNPRKT
jgi:hypothetical protein